MASYCDSEYCKSPDSYCCGHNECCTYVWAMWHLWLAFAFGIFVGLVLLWKYIKKKTRIKELDNRANNYKTPSNSSSMSSYTNQQSFLYEPLISNNSVFIENKLDDDTIQVWNLLLVFHSILFYAATLLKRS